MFNGFGSALGNMASNAFNYAAPYMAKGINHYLSNNIGSNMFGDNMHQGFNQFGSALGQYAKNAAQNGLNSVLPQHIGSGYGIPAMPHAGVAGTPSYASAAMNTPNQFLGQQTGNVLGNWAANEHAMNGMERSGTNQPSWFNKNVVEPYAPWVGSQIGKGASWLANKALGRFLPSGYSELTPNETIGRMGHNVSNGLFNMMPHAMQNRANFQELPFNGDYASGGHVHGQHSSLIDIARMMSGQ